MEGKPEQKTEGLIHSNLVNDTRQGRTLNKEKGSVLTMAADLNPAKKDQHSTSRLLYPHPRLHHFHFRSEPSTNLSFAMEVTASDEAPPVEIPEVTSSLSDESDSVDDDDEDILEALDWMDLRDGIKQ